MAQAKPGIATTILAPDPVGEGFVEISPNKTLFIQKLTNEDPEAPEFVEGLETVEQVFRYFNPSCEVEFDKEDGSTMKEEFRFSGLADFELKSLTAQSSYLRNLSVENDAYLKVIKQLRDNKSLQNVISNPATRAAFVNALKALVMELQVIEQE